MSEAHCPGAENGATLLSAKAGRFVTNVREMRSATIGTRILRHSFLSRRDRGRPSSATIPATQVRCARCAACKKSGAFRKRDGLPFLGQIHVSVLLPVVSLRPPAGRVCPSCRRRTGRPRPPTRRRQATPGIRSANRWLALWFAVLVNFRFTQDTALRNVGPRCA